MDACACHLLDQAPADLQDNGSDRRWQEEQDRVYYGERLTIAGVGSRCPGAVSIGSELRLMWGAARPV